MHPILDGHRDLHPFSLGHLFFAPAGPRGSENEYALRDERHRGVHPHGSRDLLVLDVGALAVGGIVAGVVGDLLIFIELILDGWCLHRGGFRVGLFCMLHLEASAAWSTWLVCSPSLSCWPGHSGRIPHRHPLCPGLAGVIGLASSSSTILVTALASAGCSCSSPEGLAPPLATIRIATPILTHRILGLRVFGSNPSGMGLASPSKWINGLVA